MGGSFVKGKIAKQSSDHQMTITRVGGVESTSIHGSSLNEGEDDEDMMRHTFMSIDTDGDGWITKNELDSALAEDKYSKNEAFVKILQSYMLENQEKNRQAINYQQFQRLVAQLPRVRGHRVQWGKSLCLEHALALHLKVGTLADGLKGIREMTRDQLEVVLRDFANTASLLILQGWSALQQDSGGAMRNSAEAANSKFAMTEGAFQGKFASLDDFYRGPEAHIGSPNPNIFEGMRREHCSRPNARTMFTTPNYNITTCPDWEWRFVVNPADAPSPGFHYPHTPRVSHPEEWSGRDNTPAGRWRGPGRDLVELDHYMSLPAVAASGLRREEVAALRLYTGPMFVLYNAVLRGFPPVAVAALGANNRYETTIFAVCSGVTKLAKTTPLPPGRRLYRGLGGMMLPEAFWADPDAAAAGGGGGGSFRGGVEMGLMSTTASRETALEYSGVDRRRGIVLEIQAGRIDVGASLRALSQYPSEDEFLMPPLSCLEVMETPRLEVTDKGEVIIFPVRVNVNLKCITVEELIARRKMLSDLCDINDSTLSYREELVQESNTIVDVHDEAEEMPSTCAGRWLVTASSVVLSEFDAITRQHSEAEPERFNSDEVFKELTTQAIDAKALALGKLRVIQDQVLSISDPLMSLLPPPRMEPDVARPVDSVVPPAEEDNSPSGEDAKDILERILQTPISEFGKPGIVLQLRTGVVGFPWDQVIKGTEALDLGQWTPAGVSKSALRRAHAILSERAGAVRLVVSRGNGVPFREGLFAEELNLDNQPIKGLETVLAFFLSLNTKLTSLSLRGCELGLAQWDEVLGGISEHSPITRINDLSLDCLQRLAGGGVSEVNIKGRKIGPEGAAIVFGLLSRSRDTLTSLLAEKNDLGVAGATALAQRLHHAPLLQILDLSENQMRADGAAALAASFCHLTALRELRLSYNLLTDAGGGHISKGLDHVPQLQVLDLRFNGVYSESVRGGILLRVPQAQFE